MNALSPHPRAVVFDLFGTLVDAPTPADRRLASREVAAVAAVSPGAVERVFLDSWAERHDGRLPTLDALSSWLWGRCGRAEPTPPAVRSVLLRLALARLTPAPEVSAVLERFRAEGARIAVLSDASADVAEAWEHSPLAALVDAAVFSCRAGAVKPDPALYRAVLNGVGVAPRGAVYCGDGGGDELRGATATGLTAVRVARRGAAAGLAFGDAPWSGPSLDGVEQLPGFVLPLGAPR